MTQPLRVIIFGVWTKTWMDALGPNAKLWINIPAVKEIIAISNIHDYQIPEIQEAGIKTVVIPLMEGHIYASPKQFFSLAPETSALLILANKYEFHKYLVSTGLHYLSPRINSNPKTALYPLIAKRVDLYAGNGIAYLDSYDSLLKLLRQDLWFQKPIMLQEYITGELEHVCHLVCKNGEILWHAGFVFTLTEASIIRTPSNIQSISRVNITKEVLSQFSACLKPLNFSGPCNIDFKFTPYGELKILEINPRFGGTLLLEENRDLLEEAIKHILEAALN